MIWHIFKKDWKLLWPLVPLVALAHIATESLTLILGHFNEPSDLASMGRLLFPMLALFGVTALTVMAVHQDRIPGDTQDWLTRPLGRRDVFLAKLLFVLVAVQVPLFAIDAAQWLWLGFPLAESLSAALAQGAATFCSVSLAALLLGSVTRNMTQAIFGGLGLIVLTGILVVLSNLLGQHGAPIVRSGLLWMRLAAWDLLAVLATIFVLPPLFARRHLLRARIMIAGAAALAVAINVVPWRPLFAVQQWFSPQPQAAGFRWLSTRAWDGRKTICPPPPSRGMAAPMRSSCRCASPAWRRTACFCWTAPKSALSGRMERSCITAFHF